MPPCYLFHIFFVLSWHTLRCEKCTKILYFSIVFEHRPFWLQRQIILNFRCKRPRNKPSFPTSCGHGFLIDCLMILGSFWGPKSIQNEVRDRFGTWLGKKRGPRPPGDASRRFLRLQEAARSRLRPKKAPTWPPKTNVSEGFWTSKIGLGPKRPPKTDFSSILDPKTTPKSWNVDLQTIPKSLKID